MEAEHRTYAGRQARAGRLPFVLRAGTPPSVPPALRAPDQRPGLGPRLTSQRQKEVCAQTSRQSGELT